MKKMTTILATLMLLVFANLSHGQTTITMQKEGGVFTVPCNVNGLKLKFIFDTGASDVSISMTEALFMLKNGYLKSEDILGKQYFTDATGDLSAGTKIILRKLEFAGLTLYNVEASVVHELAAPLLLGQSAMTKLGKFQLDPNNGTLVIMNGQNNTYDYGSYNSTANNNTVNNSSTNNTTSNTSKSSSTAPYDFSKLPNYSGTVKVFSYSPIYDQACMAGCKQIGAAQDGTVKIIRKENEKYYYVTSGDVTGYLFVGWVKENQN